MTARYRHLAVVVYIVLAVAPLVAVGVADAAAAQTVTIDRGPRARAGQSARIAVVGDSLMVGMAGELDRALGPYSFALDAKVGRSTIEAPASLERVRGPSADVVIIALGTNDESNAPRYQALAAAAIARVDPVAHLVWVLPHRFVPAMDPIRAVIRAAVGARPRSTTSDDEALWAHPEYRAADGLHFNAAGLRARTDLLNNAVHDVLASVTGFAAGPRGGSWTVTATGRVTALGGASAFGDAAALPLDRPLVGMASSASGKGYWLVAADGGIFSFGDARFFGSTAGLRLNAPVLAMAATSDGQGYWLLATDGGIFSFGNAIFHGSTGGRAMPSPSVAFTATDHGYLIAGTDGSVYPFGDATDLGSTQGTRLNAPVVGIARVAGHPSYRLVASDGGVFCFGPDATFLGSTASLNPPPLVAGLAPRIGGPGYTVVGADGSLYDFS